MGDRHISEVGRKLHQRKPEEYDPRVDHLLSVPTVIDVEIEMGKEETRYLVTFDAWSIPSRFDELHDLEFESAFITHEKHHFWEYLTKPTRIVGVFTRERGTWGYLSSKEGSGDE